MSQIRASQIRASQIRATEISSNHRKLHGAIFFCCLSTNAHLHLRVSATDYVGVTHTRTCTQKWEFLCMCTCTCLGPQPFQHNGTQDIGVTHFMSQPDTDSTAGTVLPPFSLSRSEAVRKGAKAKYLFIFSRLPDPRGCSFKILYELCLWMGRATAGQFWWQLAMTILTFEQLKLSVGKTRVFNMAT